MFLAFGLDAPLSESVGFLLTYAVMGAAIAMSVAAFSRWHWSRDESNASLMGIWSRKRPLNIACAVGIAAVLALVNDAVGDYRIKVLALNIAESLAEWAPDSLGLAASTGAMYFVLQSALRSFLVIAIALWIYDRIERRPMLDGNTRCGKCGYLLVHLPEARCPECGNELRCCSGSAGGEGKTRPWIYGRLQRSIPRWVLIVSVSTIAILLPVIYEWNYSWLPKEMRELPFSLGFSPRGERRAVVAAMTMTIALAIYVPAKQLLLKLFPLVNLSDGKTRCGHCGSVLENLESDRCDRCGWSVVGDAACPGSTSPK